MTREPANNGTANSQPDDATGRMTLVTVVKADISGSTPLAERLDPEELRIVLGSYFAALAREIQRQQGSIDKYIGDAVLAVFGLPEPRPDDAVRAVIASIAMQEAIQRENQVLERRYGVRLACRIGVNTGEVSVGAFGGELNAGMTVVGETVTIAEKLEAAAGLDTVLVGEATRHATHDAFAYEPMPPVIVKGWTEPLPAWRPVKILRTRDDGALSGASAGGGSRSLQVEGTRADVLAEERKIVTVLFADISSSEPLGAKLDPARLRSVLGMYFSVIARAIGRYGGTIDKYVGDAVMAVFGAPLSHEDDGARAIGAALAIQRSARPLSAMLKETHDLDIAIRVGINTGEVVAGLLPGEVLAYTVTGDAVNTAQRIESVAAPGDILVSESTYALARNAFVYEAVEPLTLKGKKEPMPAYRVTGPERRASPRDGPLIVGREEELSQLFTLYREAAAGRGQVVHVHGEAGVGKTRLVAEFLGGVPADAARVRARASSYEQGTPYALVGNLARRLFALPSAEDEPSARSALAAGMDPVELESRDAAVTVLLEILGYDVGSPLDPEGKRRLVVSVLRTVLAHRATDRPLVVLVEDLHWIDATSRGVLAEVVGEVAPTRCLFISTSRAGDDAAWPVQRVGLEALDAAAAADMVDRLAPAPLDEATRTLIVERTAGNPFFIEEVMRSLRDGKAVTVPATVQDLLEARLDALDVAPRRVAHTAAVVGRTFWTSVLARVSPGEELDPALRTLEREHLVHEVAVIPEHAYSFPHALVHEVAYRTQLMSQRRRTHVAVGDAYTGLFADRLDEYVDALAFHYRRGDDDPKARMWLLRAGHRARRLYANAEALDYFQGCIERSADEPPARAEAHEAIGDVQRVTGRYEDALSSYGSAIEIRADGADRARLRRKAAVIAHLRGDAEGARAVFADIAMSAGAEAMAEGARALLAMGEIAWRAGHYDEAVTALTAAVEAATTAADDDARAEALKHLGTVSSRRGELDRALQHHRASLALYESLGDVLGQAALHHNIGVVSRRRNQFDAALISYERANDIRARIGDQLGLALGLANVGEIHYQRGELAEAEERYRRSLEIAQSIGWATGIGMAQLGLGATLSAMNEIDEGTQFIMDALREYERAGNRTYMIDALRDLAQAYLPERPALALEAATRGLAIAREAGLSEAIGFSLQLMGMADLALGDIGAAITALEESREVLERAESRREEVARTLAALGRAYERLPENDARRAGSGRLLEQARLTLADVGAKLDLQRLGLA